MDLCARLVYALNGVGWSGHAGDGICPVSALELSAWAHATHTVLGPIDFQDILDASFAYVQCVTQFKGSGDPPPWQWEETKEETEAAQKAIEAAFDAVMGVG